MSRLGQYRGITRANNSCAVILMVHSVRGLSGKPNLLMSHIHMVRQDRKVYHCYYTIENRVEKKLSEKEKDKNICVSILQCRIELSIV